MSRASELKASAPAGSVIARMSEAEVERLLEKAAKQDKAAARQQDYNTRKRVGDALLRAKAIKAGITVSKEEIAAEMKRRGL